MIQGKEISIKVTNMYIKQLIYPNNVSAWNVDSVMLTIPASYTQEMARLIP
jgi:hypothetical protein